jgi:hypothetical protein
MFLQKNRRDDFTCYLNKVIRLLKVARILMVLWFEGEIRFLSACFDNFSSFVDA